MKTLCFRFSFAAFAAMLLATCAVHAQIAFQAVVGDAGIQESYSLKQLSDGGYIITGFTAHAGTGDDMYLIRMGPVGNVLWSYSFDMGGDDAGYAVEVAADGFVVTGKTGNTRHCCLRDDIFLLKTDNNGTFQWAKVYGGRSSEVGTCVRRTADDGYIISGVTSSFGAGSIDACLLKTNANGDLTWGFTYGDEMFDQFRSVQQTADGGYIAVGVTTSYGNAWQAYVVRTNGLGVMQWARQYGGAANEDLHGVTQTFDGGFVSAGTTVNAGWRDIILTKLTGMGAAQWAVQYSLPGHEAAYAVKQVAGNNLIVTGHVDALPGGFNGFNAYLLKTNQFGAKQWSNAYGGNDNDIGWDVVPTADDGYAFTGLTHSFGAGMSDVYTVKTDANGVTPCNITTATETVNNWTWTPTAITPKTSRMLIECTIASVRYEVGTSAVLCITTGTMTTCCCQCADTTYCVPCTNPSTFVCPCDTIVDPPDTTYCTCVCNGTTYTYPCTDPETFVCPCDTIVDPPDTTYCTCVCGDSIWTYPCPDPMAAFCPCDTVGGPPSDTTEDWPPPGPTNGGLPGSRYNEGSVNRAGLPSLQPGEQFRVYPNPVEPGESFALVYSVGRAEGAQIVVTDMLGRTVDRGVYKLAGRGAIEIKTTGWPKGMYIITVQSGGCAKVLPVVVR